MKNTIQRQAMSAAVTAAVGAAASAQQAVQWRVEDGGNGHWYLATDAPTGDAALVLAISMGGHLVDICNAAENEIVKSLLLATGKQWAWLGLRQSPGQPVPDAGWYWVTGEPCSYLNWTTHDGAFPTGAPDDSPCGLPPWGVENDQANQGAMQSDGRWDDLENGAPTCGSRQWNNAAIIEWSADCNNDGIVDYGQILSGQLVDADTNGVPDTCECPCDVFPDNAVNGIDLGVLLGQWGEVTQYTVTDFNRDGAVDGIDLGQLLAAWGPCPN
jgi:hypothetical protein